MKHLLLTYLGKFIIRASRAFGHGGSALPGLTIQRLYPHYILDSVEKFSGKKIVVTGTNGKTTTTKMIATVLRSEARTVITNKSGSNLERGVISTFVESADIFGRIKGDFVVLELDEAAFAAVMPVIKPEVTVVTNASRDQLDRYGEINTLLEQMKQGAQHTVHLLLNQDDPKLKQLRDADTHVHFYGATPGIRKLLPPDDALHGRQPVQEIAKQTKNDVLITSLNNDIQGVSFKLKEGSHELVIKLKLPGVFNAYNAAAAYSVARFFDIKMSTIKSALAAMKPAFGRGEKVYYRNQGMQIFLVKNPAGFNQIASLIKSEPLPLLIAINDNYADGTDVSWLWDGDASLLKNYKGPIITSGVRAHDMALRLKYEDIDVAEVIPEISEATEYAFSQAKKGVIAMPNYTAMLKIRSFLLERDHTREWR